MAVAVSDSSFKNQFGTATWIFFDTTNGTTALGQRSLINIWIPQRPRAYRSKLSGLYAATLLELSQFHGLRGQLKLACDGRSALHCCFKLWFSSPLTKHFDPPFQAMYATIAQLPINGPENMFEGTKMMMTTTTY